MPKISQDKASRSESPAARDLRAMRERDAAERAYALQMHTSRKKELRRQGLLLGAELLEVSL